MAMGLGAFTEGLQSGIQTRDRMDIARKYKEQLQQENALGALDLEGKRMSAAENWYAAGKDPADFDAMWGQYQGTKDPALLGLLKKGGSWLGKKMGWGGIDAGAEQPNLGAPAWEPNAMQMTPVEEPAPFWQRKADGGAIDEEEEKRIMSAGDVYRASMGRGRKPAPTGEEIYGDVDIAGAASPVLDRMGQTFARSGAANREANRSLAEKRQAIADAEGAVAKGHRIRDYAGDYGKQTLNVLAANVDDVLGPVDDWVEAGAKGVAGFFGLASDPEKGRPPNGEYPIPEDFDQNAKLYPEGVPNTKADDSAASEASVDSGVPDAQIAERAIEEGEELALENIDWSQQAAAGVRPSDIPQMTTQEWADYRAKQMVAMQMQGYNPSEALKIVDDMTVGVQMRGFQREAQKALMYLQAGHTNAAQLAMTMAYQYFPNGSTVEFGVMKDPKTGRPAIVGRGKDEETGEPTGMPTLITSERLATMVEHMSNPSAFRAWTKDNRDLQLRIAQLESQNDYRQDSLDIAAYDAESRRIAAESGRLRALSGDRSGGMTEAERRQRDDWYTVQVKEEGFENDALEGVNVPAIGSAMTIYEMVTGLPPNVVKQTILDAYISGGDEGIMQAIEEARQRVQGK